MKKIFNISILFILLLYSTVCKAQTLTPLPYFCGFETEEDMDGWILKNVENSNTNKWVVGNATAFKGEKSLYISGDNGITAGYNNISTGVAAYKEFSLEADFSYIAFDWKGLGDRRYDKLYVCWVVSIFCIRMNEP